VLSSRSDDIELQQLHAQQKKVARETVLYPMEAAEVVDLYRTGEFEMRLIQVCSAVNNASVVVVPIGLEAHVQSAQNRALRARVSGGAASADASTGGLNSRQAVQQLLTRLHIRSAGKVRSHMVRNHERCANYIGEMSRVIAQAPFRAKTALDLGVGNDANLYLQLNQPGQGGGKKLHHEMWLQYLMKIPGVSLSRAQVIIARYRSFRELYESYDRMTPEVAEALLENLRGEARTSRRIGPQLSRRVYRALYCSDPNLCVTNL
jgi:EME1/MUS81, C-terminal